MFVSLLRKGFYLLCALMLFVHEVVKGDFLASAASYTPCCVYGSMPNDGLAKNIVCMPDMLLILFVFGHGKSPFLNNGRERQHFVLSPSWLPNSKDERGCQRRRFCAVHLDRWQARLGLLQILSLYDLSEKLLTQTKTTIAVAMSNSARITEAFHISK